MKTIHITNFIPLLPNNFINTSDLPKLKTLIKELYDNILKDDPKFHYFFEPEIIIRIDSVDCLQRVKDFLTERKITFEEYDYPFPPPGKFGEDKNGIVAKNLDLFISVFHTNSVAALTMNETDHFQYIERLVHTAFNPRFMSHEQEGEWLANLAVMKLGKDRVVQVLQSK